MFIWILLIGDSNNDCELRNLSVYFQQLKIHRDIVSSYFWYPMKAWIYNFFFQKNPTFKNYTYTLSPPPTLFKKYFFIKVHIDLFWQCPATFVNIWGMSKIHICCKTTTPWVSTTWSESIRFFCYWFFFFVSSYRKNIWSKDQNTTSFYREFY